MSQVIKVVADGGVIVEIYDSQDNLRASFSAEHTKLLGVQELVASIRPFCAFEAASKEGGAEVKIDPEKSEDEIDLDKIDDINVWMFEEIVKLRKKVAALEKLNPATT